MNTTKGDHMQPMEVLQAVRKGYALATPTQLEVIQACRDFEVLDSGWVPRWALEAEALLESAGCAPNRIRDLFALGHDAVHDELNGLVRSGKLAHAIETRRPYQRLRIDLPTEMALTAALQHHRDACPRCLFVERCPQGADLQEELEHLFPRERRMNRRA